MIVALTVLLLASLLLVGFLSTRIASALRIPHSVFLVLLGLIAGFTTRNHLLPWDSSHFPDLVLYVFLPPLVFDSAYHLDLQRLKEDLIPISALAILGLVTSTLCIGWMLHWLFPISLTSGLVFGSLISATDPVAVVALFREVGAPKRLETLIDGEALFNDGTGMVLYRIFVAMTLAPAAHSHPTLAIAGSFLAVTVGSVLFGLAMSGLISLFLRVCSRSPAAQLGITVSSAFLSFLIADALLGLSGVIATLTVGLYLGWRSRSELEVSTLEGMKHLWDFLALAANTMVFLAVGLTVELGPILSHLRTVLLTITIVYLARALSISTLLPLLNRLRWSRQIPWTYGATLIWGGLRGGLALGLVLALPDAFPEKNLFLSLAAAVVMATLLLNAQTTRYILRILKLSGH